MVAGGGSRGDVLQYRTHVDRVDFAAAEGTLKVKLKSITDEDLLYTHRRRRPVCELRSEFDFTDFVCVFGSQRCLYRVQAYTTQRDNWHAARRRQRQVGKFGQDFSGFSLRFRGKRRLGSRISSLPRKKKQGSPIFPVFAARVFGEKKPPKGRGEREREMGKVEIKICAERERAPYNFPWR